MKHFFTATDFANTNSARGLYTCMYMHTHTLTHKYILYIYAHILYK